MEKQAAILWKPYAANGRQEHSANLLVLPEGRVLVQQVPVPLGHRAVPPTWLCPINTITVNIQGTVNQHGYVDHAQVQLTFSVELTNVAVFN